MVHLRTCLVDSSTPFSSACNRSRVFAQVPSTLGDPSLPTSPAWVQLLNQSQPSSTLTEPDHGQVDATRRREQESLSPSPSLMSPRRPTRRTPSCVPPLKLNLGQAPVPVRASAPTVASPHAASPTSQRSASPAMCSNDRSSEPYFPPSCPPKVQGGSPRSHPRRPAGQDDHGSAFLHLLACTACLSLGCMAAEPSYQPAMEKLYNSYLRDINGQPHLGTRACTLCAPHLFPCCLPARLSSGTAGPHPLPRTAKPQQHSLAMFQ